MPRGRSIMAKATSFPFDPHTAWQPYHPSSEGPWNLQRVGHLYRRASFGGSLAELESALKAGPEKAIDDLLRGGPGQAEFDAATAPLADAIAASNNDLQLGSWWVY